MLRREGGGGGRGGGGGGGGGAGGGGGPSAQGLAKKPFFASTPTPTSLNPPAPRGGARRPFFECMHQDPSSPPHRPHLHASLPPPPTAVPKPPDATKSKDGDLAAKWKRGGGGGGGGDNLPAAQPTPATSTPQANTALNVGNPRTPTKPVQEDGGEGEGWGETRVAVCLICKGNFGSCRISLIAGPSTER